MKLAERMSRIGVESAFDVLVRARALEAQGRSVIHLEIGEPDFPTPPHVVEAAKRALDEGWTHYGPTQGQPELREAIAAHISRTRGITPPVGFCGELSTTILVRSVSRCANRSRSKEKPRLSSSGMGTGVAPQKRIMVS